MLDIKKFLKERLSGDKSGEDENRAEEDGEDKEDREDSDWTDESDDTLEEREETSDVTIGKNWKENLPPPKTVSKPQELLTFSPPEKLPANPPSHLIWDIFGRENQKKKKLSQQQKMRTKSASSVLKTSSEVERRKSAPLSVRFDPNTKQRSARSRVSVEEEEEENVSYNSTLLRMRVVGT